MNAFIGCVMATLRCGMRSEVAHSHSRLCRDPRFVRRCWPGQTFGALTKASTLMSRSGSDSDGAASLDDRAEDSTSSSSAYEEEGSEEKRRARCHLDLVRPQKLLDTMRDLGKRNEELRGKQRKAETRLREKALQIRDLKQQIGDGKDAGPSTSTAAAVGLARSGGRDSEEEREKVERIAQLEAEIAEIREQSKRDSRELEERAAAAAVAQVEAAKAERERLEQAAQDARAAATTARADMESKERERAHFEREAKRQMKAAKEADEGHAAADALAKAQRESLADTQTEVDALRAQLESARKENGVADADKRSLVEQLDVARSAEARLTEARDTSVARLADITAELEVERSSLRASRETLENRERELEEAVRVATGADERIDKANRRRTKAERAADAVSSNLAALRATVEMREVEASRLAERAAAASKEREELDAHLAALQEEASRAGTTLRRHEAAHTAASADLVKLQARLVSLQTELDAAKGGEGDCQGKLALLAGAAQAEKGDAQRMRKQLSQEHATFKARCDSAKKELGVQITTARGELRKCQDSLHRLEDELQTQRREADDRMRAALDDAAASAAEASAGLATDHALREKEAHDAHLTDQRRRDVEHEATIAKMRKTQEALVEDQQDGFDATMREVGDRHADDVVKLRQNMDEAARQCEAAREDRELAHAEELDRQRDRHAADLGAAVGAEQSRREKRSAEAALREEALEKRVADAEDREEKAREEFEAKLREVRDRAKSELRKCAAHSRAQAQEVREAQTAEAEARVAAEKAKGKLLVAAETEAAEAQRRSFEAKLAALRLTVDGEAGRHDTALREHADVADARLKELEQRHAHDLDAMKREHDLRLKGASAACQAKQAAALVEARDSCAIQVDGEKRAGEARVLSMRAEAEAEFAREQKRIHDEHASLLAKTTAELRAAQDTAVTALNAKVAELAAAASATEKAHGEQVVAAVKEERQRNMVQSAEEKEALLRELQEAHEGQVADIQAAKTEELEATEAEHRAQLERDVAAAIAQTAEDALAAKDAAVRAEMDKCSERMRREISEGKARLQKQEARLEQKRDAEVARIRQESEARGAEVESERTLSRRALREQRAALRAEGAEAVRARVAEFEADKATLARQFAELEAKVRGAHDLELEAVRKRLGDEFETQCAQRMARAKADLEVRAGEKVEEIRGRMEREAEEKIDKLRADMAEQTEEDRVEAVRTTTVAKEAHRAEIDAARAEEERLRAEAEAACEQRMRDAREEHRATIASLQTEQREKLEGARATYARSMDDSSASHADALLKLRTQYEDSMKKTVAALEGRLDDGVEKRRAAVAKMQDQLDGERKKARALALAHDAALAEVRKASEDETGRTRQAAKDEARRHEREVTAERDKLRQREEQLALAMDAQKVELLEARRTELARAAEGAALQLKEESERLMQEAARAEKGHEESEKRLLAEAQRDHDALVESSDRALQQEAEAREAAEAKVSDVQARLLLAKVEGQREQARVQGLHEAQVAELRSLVQSTKQDAEARAASEIRRAEALARDADTDKDDAEAQLARALASLEARAAEVKEAETKLRLEASAHRDTGAELDAARQRIAEIQDEQGAARRAHDDAMKSELEERQRQLADKAADVEAGKRVIAALEAKTDACEERAAKADADLDAAQARVRTVEGERDSARGTHKAAVETAGKQHGVLQRELREARAAAEAAAAQLQRAADEVAARKRETHTAQSDMAKAEEQHSRQVKALMASLDSGERAHASEIRRLRVEVVEAQGKVDAQAKVSAEEVQAMRQRLVVLGGEASACKAATEDLVQQRQRLAQRLEAEAVAHEAHVDELGAKHQDALRAAKAEVGAANADRDAKVAAIAEEHKQADLAVRKEMMAYRRAADAKVQTAQASVDAKMREFEQVSGAHQGAMRKLREELAEVEAGTAEHATSTRLLEEERDRARADIATFKSVQAKAEEELRERLDTLRASMSERVADLERERDACVREKQGEAEAAKKIAAAAARGHADRIRVAAEELREIELKHVERVRVLEARVADASTSFAAKTGELQEREATIAEMQKQITTLSAEVEAERARVAQAKEASDAELRARDAKLASEVRKVRAELAAAEEEHTRAIAAAEADNAQRLSAEVTRHSSELGAEKQLAATAIAAEQARHDAAMSEIRKQAAATQAAHDLQKERADLRARELAEREAQISEFKDMQRALRKEIEASETQMTDMEAKLVGQDEMRRMVSVLEEQKREEEERRKREEEERARIAAEKARLLQVCTDRAASLGVPLDAGIDIGECKARIVAANAAAAEEVARISARRRVAGEEMKEEALQARVDSLLGAVDDAARDKPGAALRWAHGEDAEEASVETLRRLARSLTPEFCGDQRDMLEGMGEFRANMRELQKVREKLEPYPELVLRYSELQAMLPQAASPVARLLASPRQSWPRQFYKTDVEGALMFGVCEQLDQMDTAMLLTMVSVDPMLALASRDMTSRERWDAVARIVVETIESVQGTVRIYARVKGGRHRDPAFDLGTQTLKTRCPHEGREDDPAFDRMSFFRVFGPDESNKDVFEGCALGEEDPTLIRCRSGMRNVLEHAMQGMSVTALMFGFSGSGKTYTTMGTAEDPGLVTWAYRMMRDGDGAVASKNRVELRIVELYMRDARYNSATAVREGGAIATIGKHRRIVYREEGRGHALVGSEAPAESEWLDLDTVRVGTSKRRATLDSILAWVEVQRKKAGRIRSTPFNPDGSSRSHLFVSLRVHLPSGKKGIVTLCDLAGSEDPVDMFSMVTTLPRENAQRKIPLWNWNNFKDAMMHNTTGVKSMSNQLLSKVPSRFAPAATQARVVDFRVKSERLRAMHGVLVMNAVEPRVFRPLRVTSYRDLQFNYTYGMDVEVVRGDATTNPVEMVKRGQFRLHVGEEGSSAGIAERNAGRATSADNGDRRGQYEPEARMINIMLNEALYINQTLNEMLIFLMDRKFGLNLVRGDPRLNDEAFRARLNIRDQDKSGKTYDRFALVNPYLEGHSGMVPMLQELDHLADGGAEGHRPSKFVLLLQLHNDLRDCDTKIVPTLEFAARLRNLYSEEDMAAEGGASGGAGGAGR